MLEKKMTERGRNNKTAMTAHMASIIIFLLIDVCELLEGQRVAGLLLLDFILGLGPVIAERFFWRKNHDTEMIKHLVAIGFALFYTFEMFTTSTYVIYSLAIPIIFVVTVYHETKLVLQTNAGAFLIQILVVIIGFTMGKYDYSNIKEPISQILTMGMVAVFAFLAAKTTFENNKDKLEEEMEAKMASEKMLKDMTQMSETMTSGISKIGEGLEEVKNAANTTSIAMEQLSTGASQTTEAVVQQTSLTEQIQQMVTQVSRISEGITNRMSETMQVVSKGREDVKLLVDQVNQSVVDGDNVARKLETLDSYVEEMHSIVNIISGIANQTSMLALNASIEAARAGDAGKGFAVVATQVTDMAGKTKDATVKISELISEVADAIEEVINVIRHMIDGINVEKDSSEEVVQSFKGIRENVEEVSDHMKSLTQSVEELSTANKRIVESTTTISTISEEVLANTNETTLAQEKNTQVINHISDEMQNLLEFINKGKME